MIVTRDLDLHNKKMVDLVWSGLVWLDLVGFLWLDLIELL